MANNIYYKLVCIDETHAIIAEQQLNKLLKYKENINGKINNKLDKNNSLLTIILTSSLH